MAVESGWLGETMTFFFQGAAYGWAGGNDGSPLKKVEGSPGMEQWREAIYREDLGFAGYQLADRWGVDPDSGKPSGHIFITHWRIPVWGMWVGGGSYDKDVFAFLREALMASYRDKQFRGGRGPAQYRKDGLLYTNVVEGNFDHFKGFERIERIDDSGVKTFAGSHEYWGGSFVFLPRP